MKHQQCMCVHVVCMCTHTISNQTCTWLSWWGRSIVWKKWCCKMWETRKLSAILRPIDMQTGGPYCGSKMLKIWNYMWFHAYCSNLEHLLLTVSGRILEQQKHSPSYSSSMRQPSLNSPTHKTPQNPLEETTRCEVTVLSTWCNWPHSVNRENPCSIMNPKWEFQNTPQVVEYNC